MRTSARSKDTVRVIGIVSSPSAGISEQLFMTRFPLPRPYILWPLREIS